jgi:hypothetical protein
LSIQHTFRTYERDGEAFDWQSKQSKMRLTSRAPSQAGVPASRARTRKAEARWPSRRTHGGWLLACYTPPSHHHGSCTCAAASYPSMQLDRTHAADEQREVAIMRRRSRGAAPPGLLRGRQWKRGEAGARARERGQAGASEGARKKMHRSVGGGSGVLHPEETR